MKKFLTVFTIVFAILSMCICLTACQPQTIYFLPVITTDIEGLTIEHVNNTQNDYTLPIELTDHFTHEEFVNNEMLSSAYLIKKDGELVGWIIGDFGSSVHNGKAQYGIFADHSNGEDLHFAGGNGLRVYFSKDDEDVFETLKFTSNHGNVIYNGKDEAIDKYGNATDFVVGYYGIDLTGLDPKNVDSFIITLSLEEN